MTTNPQDPVGSPSLVTSIPTIKYYRDMYAPASDANDQKGVAAFKMFESMEKVRRLQRELEYVKGGKVSNTVLDKTLGKQRMSRYQDYENWARLMLLWITQAKQ